MRFSALTVVLLASFFTSAVAQTTTLSFSSDDVVTTSDVGDVGLFSFEIVIDEPLRTGVYSNPEIVSVVYSVSGDPVAGSPSGFPAFALGRSFGGVGFYDQGSSLLFEVSQSAVLTDGVQVAELVGAGIVFTLNAREVGNGRFHPPLLELRANGTGTIQNSNNVINENPFEDVGFGEEYVTNLTFDAGNTTLLATTGVVVPPPGGTPPPDPNPGFGSGGGAPSVWLVLMLLVFFVHRLVVTSRSNTQR